MEVGSAVKEEALPPSEPATSGLLPARNFGAGSGIGQRQGKGGGQKASKRAWKRSVAPCNYFMAGFCRYGERCTAGIHSYEYGKALAAHWCSPLATSCARVNPKLVAARDYVRIAQQQSLPMRLEDDTADAQAVLFHGTDCVAKFQDVWRHLKKELIGDVSLEGGQSTEKASEAAEKEFRRYVSFRRGVVTAAEEAESAKRRQRRGQLQSADCSAPTELRSTPEFLLVLDLEGKDEITEFPVLVLQHGREVGRFHRFVRPRLLFNEEEGFKQQGGFAKDCPSVPFSQVVDEFSDWALRLFGINVAAEPTEDANFAFVTCGEWDCKSQIPKQAEISGVETSKIRGFQRFANLKKVYSSMLGKDMEKRGMKGMLNELGWLDHTGPHQGEPAWGSHHSGMHDVENITLCLLRVLEEIDGRLPVTSQRSLSGSTPARGPAKQGRHPPAAAPE